MQSAPSKKLIIIGGGISGLSAAIIARKNGYAVDIYEASDTIGGLLNCFEVANTHLECFYHHHFYGDHELHWLLREFQLETHMRYYPSTIGIAHEGGISSFTRPQDILTYPQMNLLSKLRFGLSTLYLGKKKSWRPYEDISALNWIAHYAGAEVLKHIWLPLFKAKFGERHHDIPLAWLIGRLSQRFQARTSGGETLGYLDGGLQVLLGKLTAYIQEDPHLNIHRQEAITSIENLDHRVAVTTEKRRLGGDHTFLVTLPPPIIAKLWKGRESKFFSQLKRTTYFYACCVILELKKSISPVYWLNIARNDIPFGGLIEHTRLVGTEKYNGRHVVYLSKYFLPSDPLAQMTKEDIQRTFVAALPQIQPEFKSDDILETHCFVTPYGAPVFGLNYSQDRLEQTTPYDNLFLANMTHIYPDERSLSNAIRVAANACKKMSLDTTFVPQGNNLVPA